MKNEIPHRKKTERVEILGVPVDLVDMKGALDFAQNCIETGQHCRYALAMNPEKLHAVSKDPEMLAFTQRAGLVIPDGIGVVMAIRALEKKRVHRVPGADYMQQICAAATGCRIFFYGASEEVSSLAVENLRRKYRHIQIAGRSNGYIKKDAMDGLVEKINASGANVLFVALGSPRQEQWIIKHISSLENVRFCMGIGGTLDTIAGRVKRAPVFVQKMNLEWFFRLLQQPTRVKRQLRLIWFVWKVAGARLKTRPRGRNEDRARDLVMYSMHTVHIRKNTTDPENNDR